MRTHASLSFKPTAKGLESYPGEAAPQGLSAHA